MLSDEKLDEMFVKQIASVTKIVKHLPGNDAILPTCTRWFQIFQSAKREEKFERNCVLLMLHKQLNDYNKLGFPFTDERQHDLKALYLMSFAPPYSDEILDFSSSSDSASLKSTGQKNEDSFKRLTQLNAKLRQELQVLQSKMNELSKRREVCLANIDDLQKKNRTFHKDIESTKNIIACSSVTALEKLTLDECPQYFTMLFKVLSENTKDIEQIRKLDERLGELLRERISRSVREAMWQQMVEEYDAIRAQFDKRYKKIIEDQEANQLQELSSYGMKCLIVLKELFNSTFSGDKQLKIKVIASLEKQYKALQ